MSRTSDPESSGEESMQQDEKNVSFESLGVVDVLCEVCKDLEWKSPTAIQEEALPVAFQGRDIIGIAETGSGKTGAFAIPILQALLKTPQRYFALVLTPTRELAFQISEQFKSLGVTIGIETAVIVGGVDMMSQTAVLARKPHVIVATPGRLVDHLENTKGFSLRALKYLVMDEADRILDMDFDHEIDKILKVIPAERHTYLYSATMTDKVKELQKASLNDPVKIEVSKKYQTVEKLQQFYIFMPIIHKDIYLVHLLKKLPGDSIMVFCASFAKAQQTTFMLRKLGFTAIPLHGKLAQTKRLSALQKFKSKTRSILISTDVASRGLDIPDVDVVINFDLPCHPKDYIHRVGRTARAGRAGKSISFVTEKNFIDFQKIEYFLDKKLPVYPTVAEELMPLLSQVEEAQVVARKVGDILSDANQCQSLPCLTCIYQEMKELEGKDKKRKRKKRENDNEEDSKKEFKQKNFKKKFKMK